MAHTAMQIFDKWMDPKFKFFVNREPCGTKGRADFLMKRDNMKNEYLGACLDYIRWGGKTTVMYEFGTKGLISFIQHWMKLNKNNLIWADKLPSANFVLPYIKHDKCPRNSEHAGLVDDLGGRIRCAHKSQEKKLKPSFVSSYTTFDALSNVEITRYYEIEPESPSCDEDGNFLCSKKELEAYEKKMEEFEDEKPTFIVEDVCYAILSDEKSILSLEKVLDRLNLEPKYKTVYCGDRLGYCQRIDELNEWQREFAFCPGHREENNRTVHGFDGWALAWYIQKWYEQVPNGKAPVFETSREILSAA